MLPKSVLFPNETNECKRTWVVANTGVIQSGGTSNFTSLLTTKRHPAYSAPLTTLGLCAGRATWPFTMFIYIVRNSTWSQHPLHHYPGSSLSHAPTYPTTPIFTHHSHLETALLHLCRNFRVVFYSKDQIPFFFYLRIYFPFVV